MTELLIRPMADAFMQVGVYVAVLVAGFGWLRWRFGDRVTDGLARRPRLGPLIGALLGVSPGCGGAIILMPLYARGKVSFGTVVGALTATMGDSSWVVMAADPAFALRLHLLLFAVGLVTGYAVDALGIDPARAVADRVGGTPPAVQPSVAPPAVQRPAAPPAVRRFPASLGSQRPSASVAESPGPAVASAGARSAVALAAPAQPCPVGPLAPRQRLSSAFWGLTTPAFLISVPVGFQAVDPATLTATLGGVDPYLLLGAVGTVFAVAIFLAGKGRLVDDDLETAQSRRLRDVLRHSAHEASFVTVWVAVAYLAWQAVTTFTGFDGSQLALAGVLGVLVGALIGLIPGCAVQIVFTGLYFAGGLPLPTLIANAISQDGDALIPLAALRRHSAAMATAITTVPAILVGLGALALGW